ncbi:MAG: YjbH domain-containing protein [Oceanococcaceae bacterium]
MQRFLKKAGLPAFFNCGELLRTQVTRSATCVVISAISLMWGGAKIAYASDLALDGFPGLIHTPSASVPKAGSVQLAVSRYYPYTGLSLVVQPFGWLTTSIRYISISGREYGPGIDQSYKDKGFDLTVRLLNETPWRPAVAVGLFDIGGTSLFGSEYIVGTKNIGDFSLSAGLGWGRLGSSADLKNPLRYVDEGFSDRQTFNEQEQDAGRSLEGGEFNVSNLFAGESAGFFAGITWQPYGTGLTILLERESKAYDNDTRFPASADNEPAATRVVSDSRWNAGFRYELAPGVSAGLSYVRGNTLAGQVTFHSQWGGKSPNNRIDEFPVWEPVVPQSLGRNLESPPDDRTEAELLGDLQEDLWRRGIYASAIDANDKQLSVWFSSNFSKSVSENAVVVGRLVYPRLSERYSHVTLTQTQAGATVASLDLDYQLVDDQARGKVKDADWAVRSGIRSKANADESRARYADLASYPAWSWGINPALRSNIGGPTGFYQVDVQVKPFATMQLNKNNSLTGTLAWSVIGNLDELEPRDSSNLPNVRSDLESYQSIGPDLYIEEIEFNSVFDVAPDVFGRVSFGIFEDMYGGVGAEILWRPLGRSYALGLDLARVRQRDYDQLFTFRDYEATTGHLTLYWRTPWLGINVETSFGQYLAGDVGMTFKTSRRFPNGFEVGAFFSQTNVSAEDFGEGSFDKGVFMSVPITAMDRNVRGSSAVNFNYRFLTRDGGQKVDSGRPLYPLVEVNHREMAP